MLTGVIYGPDLPEIHEIAASSEAYGYLPFTVHDKHLVRQYPERIYPDFYVLTCCEDTACDLHAIRKTASIIRVYNPRSVIVLYCHDDYARQQFEAGYLPARYYDLPHLNGSCPDLLMLQLEAAGVGSNHRNLPRIYSRPLTGIVYLPISFQGDKHAHRLQQCGWLVIACRDLIDVQVHAGNMRPDFILLHCHTPELEFENVKQLTRLIQRELPSCILLLSCGSEVQQVYDLSGYRYHQLVDPFMPLDEVVELILSEDERRNR